MQTKNPLAKRIIPCLDIKNARVVKGVNFVGLTDAGDTMTFAKVPQFGAIEAVESGKGKREGIAPTMAVILKEQSELKNLDRAHKVSVGEILRFAQNDRK